ncbi:MAG: hypothetical protein ABSF34_15450 [Verrucomicrobiota bacterium]
MLYLIKPDGNTTLFAGQPVSAYGSPNPGYSDGYRLQSSFQNPEDATVDQDTNIFVSDDTRLRKIRPDGWVSTMAGTAVSGYQNGRGYVAQFNGAAGLCVDTNGNIFVADSANNCIREISPDTFGIGIPDWWQLKYFGYIGIDPNADPDHDGMSNYEEFWAGTEPLDPNSFFAIKSVVITVGNHAQINWQTVAGKNYSVQYSDDLKTWSPLATSITGYGTVASVLDSTPTQQAPQRLYRVFVNF